MSVNVNEPATWFADEKTEGVAFDLLEMAVLHAVATPVNERNSRARIVTKSGATYGWDAINHVAERFK